MFPYPALYLPRNLSICCLLLPRILLLLPRTATTLNPASRLDSPELSWLACWTPVSNSPARPTTPHLLDHNDLSRPHCSIYILTYQHVEIIGEQGARRVRYTYNGRRYRWCYGGREFVPLSNCPRRLTTYNRVPVDTLRSYVVNH